MVWLPTAEEIDQALAEWKPLRRFACVYVLWDGGCRYYVGSTINYERRLQQHRAGEGSKQTKLWLALGRTIHEYWKIEVGISVRNFKTHRKDRPMIENLEQLVSTTLKRQNPRAVIVAH